MDTETNLSLVTTSPGHFDLIARPLLHPQSGQIRVKVLTCSFSCVDAKSLYENSPHISFPRVPGHSVIGTVDAIGPAVQGWKLGQRVACGLFGGECGLCPPCRQGDIIHCEHQVLNGVNRDGGLAEFMIAEARALVLVPEKTSALHLVPFCSAGVTAFSVLRSDLLEPGNLILVDGLEGIGHLALQFARRMGYQVISAAAGMEHASDALRYGAHAFIDTMTQDVLNILQSLGGAKAILSTVSRPESLPTLLKGLSPRGSFIPLVRSSPPVPVNLEALTMSSRRIVTMRAGTPFQLEETFRFAISNKVVPDVRALSLEDLLCRLRRKDPDRQVAFDVVSWPARDRGHTT